jgi:hypothetical protein
MRMLLVILALSAACFETAHAAAGKTTLRGTLVQEEGKPPVLRLADGKTVVLDGDKDTKGVLNDKRLAGVDLEVIGEMTSAGLKIDPIHMKGVFVHKDGKRFMVTYWCDVCSIRTFTPGICWCCQDETALDLRDPHLH